MEIAYRAYGQGAPIIILHGLFGFSDNWQTIAKAFSDRYTVFTVDQRNHGKSAHLPTHTYADMSQDLHHFMSTNWMFKSIIMGHSMGGKTAMQFALDNPDMVEKLVVIDIAPGPSKTRQDEVISALNTAPIAGATDRKTIENHLQLLLNDAGTVQFLLKNLTRNTSGLLEWKMNLPVLTKAHDDILAPVQGDQFEGPTLFVRGERSSYITEEDLKDIKRHFPSAKVVTIPNAGHWVHTDQPNALIQELKNFFETN